MRGAHEDRPSSVSRGRAVGPEAHEEWDTHLHEAGPLLPPPPHKEEEHGMREQSTLC